MIATSSDFSLVFAVLNAALLAFKTSAFVNQHQDQIKSDVDQNDAVPNAQGATNTPKLLPLPFYSYHSSSYYHPSLLTF